MNGNAFARGCILLLAPAIAWPTEPTARLEHAQIIASGNSLRINRAPLMDKRGKVRYHDLSIMLNVTDDGSLNNRCQFNYINLSPELSSSSKFVPGTYSDPTGYICKVEVSHLLGGRAQTAMSCVRKSPNDPWGERSLSSTWVDGPLEGHPFELDLANAGVDKISGNEAFSWGKVSNGQNNVHFGCFRTGDVLGATQVGEIIQISGYESGNLQKCGAVLVRQSDSK